MSKPNSSASRAWASPFSRSPTSRAAAPRISGSPHSRTSAGTTSNSRRLCLPVSTRRQRDPRTRSSFRLRLLAASSHHQAVMRDLPSGTVTFLFTDVEGSTRLLADRGDAYAGLLAEHRSILRAVLTRRRGVEVDTQGDALLLRVRQGIGRRGRGPGSSGSPRFGPDPRPHW